MACVRGGAGAHAAWRRRLPRCDALCARQYTCAGEGAPAAFGLGKSSDPSARRSLSGVSAGSGSARCKPLASTAAVVASGRAAWRGARTNGGVPALRHGVRGHSNSSWAGRVSSPLPNSSALAPAVTQACRLLLPACGAVHAWSMHCARSRIWQVTAGSIHRPWSDGGGGAATNSQRRRLAARGLGRVGCG